jgi:hypothetical protein
MLSSDSCDKCEYKIKYNNGLKQQGNSSLSRCHAIIKLLNVQRSTNNPKRTLLSIQYPNNTDSCPEEKASHGGLLISTSSRCTIFTPGDKK